MSNFLNNANKNWSVVAGQIQNQAANGIVYIKESAFQIPTGTSNERPIDASAGMIRYLTNDDLIEYYNANTGSWLPISQPPPTITSINPDFVSSGATGQSINVFGTNFTNGTSVSFIGQDLTVYNSGITTSFINENQLSASVPSSVADNSSNDPYSVKVTNPSGLSAILSDSLNINERPVFTTLQDPNIYATVDACFNVQPQMDLSASDFGNHFPLHYDECGNILSTKNLTLNSSGAIVGIPPLPSLYTALSYSEIFNAIVTDISSAVSLPGEFKFVVQRPINNFTQTGGTVTYADTVNGVAINTSSTTPYTNGSVIIKYTNTSGTHNFIPSFPASVPVQTMIVGGGGGGGSNIGGGGGAGGVIITEILTQDTSFSAISVGSGGAGGAGGVENNTNIGTVGNNTTLTYGSTTLTANGGGFGGRGGGGATAGGAGGSGGGGGGWNSAFAVGGASNQGDGGIGYSGGRGSGTGTVNREGGGGGGGAGFYGEQFKQIGSTGGDSSRVAGAGGIGIISNIDGTNKYYAGGGGGGYYGTPYSSFGYVSGLGGQGGGGNGATGLNTAGSDATSNSGSGGGGSSGYSPTSASLQKGGDGGSGIVILRFPYVSQVYRPALNELIINDISNASINIIYTDNDASGGAVQTTGPVAGGYTIYEFICGPNTDTTSPSFNGLITFTPNNDLSNVHFLVVAGGGGGHGTNGAGGGAGGLRTSFLTAEGTSGGGGIYQSTLDFSANNNYNIVIGNGGGNYYSGTVSDTTGVPSLSTASYNGGDSSLQYNGGTISCKGGGGGTGFSNNNLPGNSGGSGGGGGGSDLTGTQSTGGAGTTNEGFPGGNGNLNNTQNGGGGGGGAGGAGDVAFGSGTSGYGGNGGAAINSYIKGNGGFVVAGGGGGGWGGNLSTPAGGTSGGTPPTAINGNQQGGASSGVTVGGRGGFGGNTASDCIFPTNPTPHTGSGGAGGGQMFGTSGSSGVVCIRFPSFA